MDYQIILDRLDELDDEISEDLTPAIRVVEAMEKISAALNTSDTLEGMLNRIVGIVSDMEEED
jgi:hypothetical protein